MKLIHFALAITLASTGAYADTHGNSNGNTTSNDKTSKPEKLSSQDEAIIDHQHAVNQMEINLGQLAQKNSTNRSIQDYGKEVATDHQKLDGDLKEFAKKSDAAIGRDIPTGAADKQAQQDDQSKMSELKTLKGPAFDQKFLDMMVAGHERELGRLDTAINEANNEALKLILTAIRPAMQTHLDTAKSLRQATPRT